ncbi:hypothetical protein KDK_52860 [Dictyobacter kobayashii]|uniref:Uncharacterized protein n=1 Tax=Dictyobacter kobayashii TaxID=2014872 RepID=A0A402AQW3_9CHLR|nr:hypothetical protein KDK_52860 [Dictyobacter kobayashii]
MITVTITNGLSHTIYMNAPKTSCTMVQLEMLVNGVWNPIGRCVNVAAMPTLQVAPGNSTLQHLQPQIAFGLLHSAAHWQPGTYRVSLGYNTILDPDTIGGSQHATSNTFTIN